jgi:hypothetical protein
MPLKIDNKILYIYIHSRIFLEIDEIVSWVVLRLDRTLM